MNFNEINYYMSMALDLADEAYKHNEVPIGAIIVSPDKKVIGQGFNLKEENQNPVHHAEILAIKEASEKINSWRLIDCDLYVTLEPCPMCMSALQQARIKNVYFGAYDPKGGARSLGFNLNSNTRLNHNFNLYGGFKHIECAKLLSNFFKQKRGRYKS